MLGIASTLTDGLPPRRTTTISAMHRGSSHLQVSLSYKTTSMLLRERRSSICQSCSAACHLMPWLGVEVFSSIPATLPHWIRKEEERSYTAVALTRVS